MERRVTWDWLRKYANQHKHASYQDKLRWILHEKNPYYLLEWLVFPVSDTEREQIDAPRSPGLRKNSYIPFVEAFVHQLLYDVCFGGWEADEELKRLLLATAIRDLRRHYGGGAWDEAARRWAGVLRESARKYEQFKARLEMELEKLRRQHENELREIAVRFADDEFAKQRKQEPLRSAYETKRDGVPRKLLQKQYGEWPLVDYMFLREWTDPTQRMERFADMMLSAPAVDDPAYLEKGDFELFFQDIIMNPERRKRFLPWFAAYASAAGLIRGSIDTADRQIRWTRFLEYAARIEASESGGAAERRAALREAADVTFDISGIENIMIKDEVPYYFPLLVQSALQDENRRKWLEEKVILRHWDAFMRLFMREPYDFCRLSWVLCLDPVSLEERLLRRNPHASGHASPPADAAMVVERCSEIFADGMRSGFAAQRLTPVFQYVAAHNPDALYAFIGKIRDCEGLLPLLDMEDRYLQRLFGGEGVRSVAARKHVRPLFLAWVRQCNQRSQDRPKLMKLGGQLAPDKKELLLEWLSGASSEPAAWPCDEAGLLAEIFHIEWLGAPSSAESHHDTVERWLAEGSDAIRFEQDAPLRTSAEVQYRIVRPGIRDSLTGHVLARAVVRAEFADRQPLSGLLDELKQL